MLFLFFLFLLLVLLFSLLLNLLDFTVPDLRDLSLDKAGGNPLILGRLRSLLHLFVFAFRVLLLMGDFLTDPSVDLLPLQNVKVNFIVVRHVEDSAIKEHRLPPRLLHLFAL